ncbi:leiomodin-1-like isoform X2 [Entelurus aequoreus]|nr:leiomodin-1-like isoform X2 [Entelurus aequoreus]XP_061894156.1 leiomodin-1-like isoform X2 [Entelurus aequoreus]
MSQPLAGETRDASCTPVRGQNVRGLTRMGRQVSEDPDLDNLLSTLSPEEMEELEKDMMKVPDLNLERPQEETLALEPKKECRKQEHLRKMGLSQEGNQDGKVRRPADTNAVGPEVLKQERGRLSERFMKQESAESEDSRTRDRRENRESTGSKTRDVVSKLQEKKEDSGREKDCRKRDDSKTKDIISRLREKSEKEVGKDRERRSESFRTQGLVSRMLEKQSKAQENQEKKAEEKMITRKLERQVSQKEEKAGPDAEELLNHSEHVTEKKTENVQVQTGEKLANCVAQNAKTNEQEDEDEDSSMFDELMQQLRHDDPSLVELNVNNSEVIKTKTLMEFAEALRGNTHVKKVALANCRADDHVAYAVAGTLRHNATVTSINLDSNHLTGKGILALIQALQHNATLTELRFQNQRHICGGKTEMEMIKILKENTTLLKLGYHFELAGPRMTTTNILSRNMDRQRQKRLQEQKQAQSSNGDKKESLELPKVGAVGSLRSSPKPSPMASPMPSPKLSPKRSVGAPPPPPPPPGGGLPPPAPPGGGLPPPPPPGGGLPPPAPPMLEVDSLRNSLTPVSRRSLDGKGRGACKNSRDQLLASIRGSNVMQLKKVPVPKWLQ